MKHRLREQNLKAHKLCFHLKHDKYLVVQAVKLIRLWYISGWGQEKKATPAS